MAGLLGLLSDAAELTSKTAKVAPKVAKAGEVMSIPADIAAQFVKAADPAHIRGAEVMDMLKSGRGSEVTDQMLDMGDPVLNARLNEYLYKNSDIPMDEASRMARAGDMGFNTVQPLYHGTDRDFQAFDARKFGEKDSGWYGRGVTTDTDPEVAGAYANYNEAEIGQQILPLTSRGKFMDWPKGQDPFASVRDSVAGTQDIKKLGYDGTRMTNDRDLYGNVPDIGTEQVTFNPANVRSRFARFDPRLSHLKNLSASFGAGLLGANMMPNNDGSR
jgi:hypothetical protein